MLLDNFITREISLNNFTRAEMKKKIKENESEGVQLND